MNNTIERILTRKVIDHKGCWIWTGCTDSGGYAQVSVRGKDYKAHRFVYQSLIGEIPDGLQLDHLCRVRHCINPAHLEPVTLKENVLRGVGLSALNQHKTTCPAGHQYDEQNTYMVRNQRHCRSCVRNRAREYQRRKYGYKSKGQP